ncbi:MAG: hypothetical protein LIQ31_00125 [Planctomycetes bacterium]|nr:hypothetical protein [Planctomycetota bacterium]
MTKIKPAEPVDVDAVFKKRVLIKEAIRCSGIEAVKMYIQAGKPMASWRDGKVYMIPPEELKTMLAAAENADQATS